MNETVNSSPEEYRCDPSAVLQFLSNPDAMAELLQLRNVNGDRPLPSAMLRELLGNVYQTFEPAANRMIRKRMAQFPNLDRDTQDNIYAEQHFRLWNLIINDFNWHTHSQAHAAIGAFISYLHKATGSFFASEVIFDQRQSGFAAKQKNRPLKRPVEEAIIQQEEQLTINRTFESWRQETPPIYVEAVDKRYLHGKTVENQAAELGLPESTVKKRLNVGKKKLFHKLQHHDIISPNDVLSGKIVLGQGSRQDLLNSRRRLLQQVITNWTDILEKKPKLWQALDTYYGLSNSEPVYDYQKTAEITGLSLASVRVLVSEGVRLVLGKLKPSPTIQHRLRTEELYQYWKNHQQELQLSDDVVQILHFVFNEGKNHLEISRLLNTSEETIRRRSIRALNLIEASRSR